MKRTALLFAALAALGVARAEPPPAATKNAATLSVVAGATISDLSIAGNHAFETKKLVPETGVKTGDVYQAGDETVAARLVKAFYQRNGYLEAEVTASTEAAPGAVRIALSVDEGPS